MPRLFCFGLGYVGSGLARRLLAEGWEVAGTRRSAECARARSDELGIPVWPFDRARPLAAAERALAGTTHLLSSVPPDDAGDPVLHACAPAIAAVAGLRWLGYLSSLGVYGDRGGAWVDEGSPPGEGGDRRRLGGEAAWLAFGRDRGIATHVFRLGGIYGPGRSPLDRVRQGRARRLVAPGHVLNRVHVDDIVAVLVASMRRPRAGAVYNVTDGAPLPDAEAVALACRLLGAPVPPEEPVATAELSALQRGLYEGCVRVRRGLITSELGVVPRHPDILEGLRAILAVERQGH
jgi:nucleoside-diphosphate-sugar epimerase